MWLRALPGAASLFEVQAVWKEKSEISTLKSEKPTLLGGSKLPKPICASPRGPVVLSI